MVLPTYSDRADRVARHAAEVSPSRAARNMALFLPWLLGFMVFWSWSWIVYVGSWIGFGFREGFDLGRTVKAKLSPRGS